MAENITITHVVDYYTYIDYRYENYKSYGIYDIIFNENGAKNPHHRNLQIRD